MTTKEDVELIRQSEHLHTRFILWLCLFVFACVTQFVIQVIFYNSPLLVLLTGVGVAVQLVLAITTLFCFKAWRKHRDEKVERIYNEHKKVAQDIHREYKCE